MNFKERVFNFSAGPSMLPEPVLEKASCQLLNYECSGQSVMEMSHRSSEFKTILADAESNLRKLLKVPQNFKILFLQGGGTLQFSMVPLNLLRTSGKADYVVTGSWAKKAMKEAKKFGDIRVVASSEDDTFSYIPKLKRSDFRSDADYVYICMNNTIYGTHYSQIPDTGDIPLVADMSSCLLSEKIDFNKFGLIFAGAQKNIGPAGVTIVLIREDLVGFADEETVPVYLNYKIHVEKDSAYNTPPCFTIYMAGEVFKHIIDMGGVEKIHTVDMEKAEMLYEYLDSTDFYKTPVRPEDRSIMNVVFVTGDESLDKKFVEEAKKEGLINLNGHRSIGGMRASIYNAMPKAGVEKLIAFMKKFESENI